MRKKKQTSSNPESVGYYAQAREYFDLIRYQKKEGFSLRWRLFIVVATGLAVGIWLGYGITELLRPLGIVLENLEFVLAVTLVSLLVALGFSLLTSRWIFKPINNLRVAIEKVADGDFSVRLMESSTAREIQEVYSGFNLMAHELGSTEMLRQDFTSNVSHEFKTPIAAIEGYSTLLQGCDNLDEQNREYVDKILFNTKRLSGLVGNILILSKLENQTIETNKQSFSLDEQIRESLLGLESAWMQKNIEFDVDLDTVNFVGNEGLMRHVWDNLISNAVKFSPNGGFVKITLRKSSERVVFEIEDEGPGIPNEAKKHIFDKFYQYDSSRKQEGHGLGLALVKRIIDISEGKIVAENVDGGGARFIVTFEKTQKE